MITPCYQHAGASKSQFTAYDKVIRFNLTIVLEKRMGLVALLNKFSHNIFAKHFRDALYVVADLKTSNPHYVQSMRDRFQYAWSWSRFCRTYMY